VTLDQDNIFADDQLCWIRKHVNGHSSKVHLSIMEGAIIEEVNRFNIHYGTVMLGIKPTTLWSWNPNMGLASLWPPRWARLKFLRELSNF